jgi:O-antigen/teichoic acid export membrane protein
MEDLSQELIYKQTSGAIRKLISDKISRLKGTDIKAKSIRAVMALGAGTFAGRGLRFIRNMIIARILAPDQIGIMVIVMSLSMGFEAFTEVGVKQSIIQNKQGANDRYLNVAWWMQVIRAMCLYIIAFLSAPWLSSFYDYPELSKMLRVAFIAIALRGFISPRAAVLEKEYKFGRVVLLVQGSAVLGAIISVVMALIMRSVWALVIGFVIEMAIYCIFSFILVPFIPKFEIERGSFVELMRFARRMFGLPLLTAISFYAPTLILGKAVSKELTGLYGFAALFCFIATDFYLRTIAPVLLPAFSEKQDDKRALCRGVLHTAKWTSFFVIPLAAFIACSSSKLLLLAYGPKYATMSIPLAVLCIQIVIRNQIVCLTGLYLAIGQPHLQRRFAAIRAVVILGLGYHSAVFYGPLGIAVVIVLSNFIVLLMQVFKAQKVIGLNIGWYIRSYIQGLWMALPILVAAGLLRVFGVDSTVIALTISVLVIIATFAVSLLIMNRLSKKA